jgi:hypothetical protein
MVVKKSDNTTETQPDAESEDLGAPVDYSTVPGFHVFRGDGVYLGTYGSEEDAQAFIDGHVAPQGIEASITEGAAVPAE